MGGLALPLLWVDVRRIEELSMDPSEHSQLRSEDEVVEPAGLELLALRSNWDLRKFCVEVVTTFDVEVVLRGDPTGADESLVGPPTYLIGKGLKGWLIKGPDAGEIEIELLAEV